MRTIASEPSFLEHYTEPLNDSKGDSIGTREVVRVRYVRNLRQGVTIAFEKVKSHRRKFFAGGAIVGSVIGFTCLVVLIRMSSESKKILCGDDVNYRDIQHYSTKTSNLIAVNLGGWLCLEDWFFSGSIGRYVSTPVELSRGQGACLPPMVNGPLEEPWPSEGVLAYRLNKTRGPEFTATAFKAHRESFISQTDFAQLRDLGIKSVRIPMTWATFADVLTPVDPVYGKHNPETDTVLVPDPYYYENASFATVPRQWLRETLRSAADNGLRVILDLHNMPGGSSDGTYSGVWPAIPQFWMSKTRLGKQVPLTEVGLWLSKALIDWVESFKDLIDRGAIWGMCLLNEPAHMSAGKKWANESQVLEYVENFTNLFRQSSLPGRGVRLYVQIIESAFKDFDGVVPQWYNTFFSKEERHSWAVMARHFYTAWSPACQGLVIQGGGYQCDQQLQTISSKLRDCVYGFAGDFVAKFDGMCAVTEWSLGTHFDANMACSNSNVLRAVFEANVDAFSFITEREAPRFKIEPFFWTWRMPYGPKFQPGWSLKYFSGLAKDENQDSNGECVVGNWAMENPLGSQM